jgi:XRE family transcriptional regulator, regulator of sulfur utilization
MVIGDKIRNLRTLKGLSQENMAEALKMSLVAYGDIERNKKDINLNRLEQISKVLNVTIADILAFSERVANFFDQCNQPSVVAGTSNIQNNNYDSREVQHKYEKAILELEKLKVEKEKAELEAKYWRERNAKE